LIPWAETLRFSNNSNSSSKKENLQLLKSRNFKKPRAYLLELEMLAQVKMMKIVMIATERERKRRKLRKRKNNSSSNKKR
jgi:hypothetical protein